MTCESTIEAYEATKAYRVCHGISGLDEKECVNFLSVSVEGDKRNPYIQVLPMSGAIDTPQAKFYIENCL